MTLSNWLSFCLLELVLCLTPGPAVTFVATTALKTGSAAGLRAAYGIVMGNLCYFALSATGVAALLLASAKLFKGLQIVGALYLLLLGFQMLRPDSGKTAAAEVIAPAGARAPFWRGLTVQLLNPKALIFFVSLLPQFVTTTAPVALQILVLGISSQLIEIATLAFYVAVAAQARNLGDERSARWLGRIGGALLIAIAARLLWRQ